MKLPEPTIVGCGVEETFAPRMPAMCLHWNGTADLEKPRPWTMPLGLVIAGPVPTRFGIEILRLDEDQYAVRVVWDRIALAWKNLTRAEVRNTVFPTFLASLGTDLEYLLDQPVLDDPRPARACAEGTPSASQTTPRPIPTPAA
ncbi:MAG: hypothetical protein L0Z62_49130 [Gemmataceae bacterium]|nr:hypothetical protein [Gemmataceae bacterium]